VDGYSGGIVAADGEGKIIIGFGKPEFLLSHIIDTITAVQQIRISVKVGHVDDQVILRSIQRSAEYRIRRTLADIGLVVFDNLRVLFYLRAVEVQKLEQSLHVALGLDVTLVYCPDASVVDIPLLVVYAETVGSIEAFRKQVTQANVIPEVVDIAVWFLLQ
jgi:hypothetical protein